MALRVTRVLREAGFEAWFVGGCVRDQLLGRPVKDWDVATAATPDEVQGLFRKVIPVGAQFGVCRVRLSGVEIEVATFRTDEGYADGRRPTAVRYTSAREDVLRRDFTVNGLLQDPETGAVVDHVGGRADLERGLIRAIGDPEARFAEDRLRMLRAVRFAARLGFALDPATAAAIRRHAAHIVAVSAERIRDELLRILTEGGAARGFADLDALGLLGPVLPEIAGLGAADRARIRATLARLDAEPAAHRDPRLGLAVLLHRLPPPAAAAVVGRLALPRRIANAAFDAVRDLPTLAAAPTWPLHRVKRTLRAPHAATLIDLHRLVAAATDDDAARAVAARIADWRDRFGPDDLQPAPLLRGADFQALGYPRGPLYREIQTALEDAQLDGAITTADEARAFLRDRFGDPHGATLDRE